MRTFLNLKRMPLITTKKMLCLNLYMPLNLLVLRLLTWLLGPQNTVATIRPTYVNHSCTNTTTFTPNSIYHSNLKQLLSFLSSNATNHEFYNATAGQDSATSVYGNFLCAGYINATACRDCVVYATDDVVKWCPVEKQSIIWYDECQLRYSNRSFFGTMDELPRLTIVSIANITSDLEPLREKLNFTIKDAAAEAANGGGKRYATKEANFSGFQTVYTSVQCTPDLYIFDCMKCISDAFEGVVLRFSDRHRLRTLLPSCSIRFALYPFYNQTASPLSPLASSPTSPVSLPRPKGKSKISTRTLVAIVVSILVLFIGGGYLLVRRARSKFNAENQENAPENAFTTIDSLQFDLATIEAATSKFSTDNKLGEGGFGEVYKGMLRYGQEIAVKRLSKSSSQGEEEFKNEVVLVAKLQHRNLVRLLGFCVGGSEKLLVYEFVPNKSLDYSLFDREKEVEILDWSKRQKIIGGIARGILYLHEDSRLRVIHRDLKASNVLLDADMNPKISDFGMARMFGIDQTEGNTRRIVGTYGYMAPEYAMEGLYSIKSDVFSFGVLLLEILCGRRNTGFHYPTDSAPSLVAYAWQLWNAGEVLELMDPLMKDSCPPNELTRYVHIGLLCVQEDANKRPTMSTVVLMLKSESLNLSQPERPAFFVGRFTQQHHETGINGICSGNTMTISDFVPR